MNLINADLEERGYIINTTNKRGDTRTNSTRHKKSGAKNTV